jgi:uncharacterized membrane protein
MLTAGHLLGSNFFLSAINIVLICTLPGYAILFALGLNVKAGFTNLFLSIVGSLFVIEAFFAGFSVLLHRLGFIHSFTTSLVLIVESITLALSALFLSGNRHIQCGMKRFIRRELLSGNVTTALTFLLIPGASLVAVTRLNERNDSRSVGIFLYLAIALYLFMISKTVIRRSIFLHYALFYLTTLAILFGSTFRGDGGFWGYDINAEYAVAIRTLTEQNWLPLSTSAAYHSMLSITVLPAVLSVATKLSLTVIFKVFYPLLAALIPLAIYSVLSKYVRHSVAMSISVIEIVGSISFIPQMTALARQVVGILFFVAILIAIFDQSWSRRNKISLVIAFALGLSFSHYSTAYLTSLIFLIVGLLSSISLLFRRRGSRLSKPIITLPVAFAVIGMVVLWNGVVTHSLQDAKATYNALSANGAKFLPNSHQSFIQRWFSGVSLPTKFTSLDMKTQVLATNLYKYPSLEINPVSLLYNTTTVDLPKSKPVLGKIGATVVVYIYLFSNTLAQGLVVAALFLGARFLFQQRKRRKKKEPENSDTEERDVWLDALPLLFTSFFFAVLLRSSKTFSEFYNPERAAFQLALIFSLPVALTLERLINSRLKIVVGLTGFLLPFSSFIFLQQNSGLAGYLYGTPDARINNSVSANSHFIISEQERASADWVATNVPLSSYVQVDAHAVLSIIQSDLRSPKKIINQIAPYGIFKGSYVYLSQGNFLTGLVEESNVTGTSTVFFAPPMDYLDKNLSLVYSSGGARVYR